MPDRVLEKIQNGKHSCHSNLIGVPTYSILDNWAYQKELQYVPQSVKNRENFIVDDAIDLTIG